MRNIALVSVLFLAALPVAALGADDAEAARWWPAQKVPRVVVRSQANLGDPDPGPGWAATRAEHMLLQSVSGLLAQAVNDGPGDEMLWIDEGARTDYARWYPGMLKRLGAREEGPLSTSDLIKRYAGRGIIKGYILYKSGDALPGLSKSERRKSDAEADQSVNVATTMSGLLGGVIVSEEQEPAAKALGLARLFDARGKTPAWCLQQYHEQLSRSFILSQRPRVAFARDVAVANRMLVIWNGGNEAELSTAVYAWLNPLSTIIGWVGNEGEDVAQASRYGHVVVPSDLCLNLPLLSAGVDPARSSIPPLKTFDPRSIDAKDTRSAVSFVMSDGDNLQWAMGGFFGNDDYWASPDHGKFPVGFGLPFGCLEQLCPEAVEHLAATQPDASTIIQASGYIFPDLFGAALDPARRRELLARHARRLGQSMGATGVTSLVFICRDVDSPAAIEAYEIYAREIDGLAGMFVIQYAPYEAGDGRVHWVKDRAGADIPVVTSKFSIWANNKNAGAGNPARVAELINGVAAKADAAGKPANLWVMAHAWSPFQRDSSTGDVSDLPFGSREGSRGVTPIGWCTSRLDKDKLRVVTPAELLWRIRQQRSAK